MPFATSGEAMSPSVTHDGIAGSAPLTYCMNFYRCWCANPTMMSHATTTTIATVVAGNSQSIHSIG
jgi:hypothetical protein